MQTVQEVMKKVVHKADCRRAFKNYDKTCPRCQELSAGLSPRQGWYRPGQSPREVEARQIAEIRAHNCKVSNCGPVCTFGDW